MTDGIGRHLGGANFIREARNGSTVLFEPIRHFYDLTSGFVVVGFEIPVRQGDFVIRPLVARIQCR